MRYPSAIGGAFSPLFVMLPLLVAPMPLAAQAASDAAALAPDSVRAGLALRPSYVRDPVRVLIVGTWHFANPGLEYNGVEKDFSNGEYGPRLVNDFALDFIERHSSKARRKLRVRECRWLRLQVVPSIDRSQPRRTVRRTTIDMTGAADPFILFTQPG